MVTTRTGKKGIGTELFTIRPVNDIGTLGGAVAAAHDVNASGTIVGNAQDSGSVMHPFVWTPADGMRSLPGAVTMSKGGYATGINDANVVAGYVGDRAARWTLDAAGVWTLLDLGSLGGSFAFAFAINNAGTIVGYSSVASGDHLAFHWTQAGGMVALPMVPGGSGSRALAINSAGDVAGDHILGGYQRPVMWPAAGGVVQLPLCPNAVGGQALGLNDAGWVVGDCTFAKGGNRSIATAQAVRSLRDPVHPGAWLAPQALTSPTACPACDRAFGVNSLGEIVGISRNLPFLWDEAHGLRLIGTLVASGTGQSNAVSDPLSGAQSLVVGMVGKGGASGGNRAVWWRHP